MARGVGREGNRPGGSVYTYKGVSGESIIFVERNRQRVQCQKPMQKPCFLSISRAATVPLLRHLQQLSRPHALSGGNMACAAVGYLQLGLWFEKWRRVPRSCSRVLRTAQNMADRLVPGAFKNPSHRKIGHNDQLVPASKMKKMMP